jgi:hypothetical protein
VVLEAIPRYPSGSSRKLDRIQNNEDVRDVGLIEESGIRGEIGLVGG